MVFHIFLVILELLQAARASDISRSVQAETSTVPYRRSRQRERRFTHFEWKLSHQEAMQAFEEYYQCLHKKNRLFQNTEYSISPVIAQVGQTVRLKCPICSRPDQDPNAMFVSWQHLKRADSTLRVIDSNEHYRITDKWTLLVYEVDMNDVGQYYCTERGEYIVVYQLDILTSENRQVVLEKNAHTLLGTKIIMKNNLELFTSWSQWSQCDQCDKPGHRQKIGLCMVKKFYKDRPTEPVDFPLMVMYKSGVPCRSTALPKTLAQLGPVWKRPGETLVGECQVPCPTLPPPMNITDANGKVLEVIEPGFYPIGSNPKLPAMVKRQVKYEDAGIHLTLTCPSDKELDQQTIIQWQRGKRKIDPLTIRRQTRGRVYVDHHSRLNIRKLLVTDTAPYNCWIRTQHIATIKVIVVEKFNAAMKDYISYAGFILMAVLVILVFCCTCCRRRSRSAH